jgi:hypothetical protein
MLTAYCHDNEKSWDEGVPLVLFAAREVVQESLGFSPFQLVFGHEVRGPLKLLQEKWLCEDHSKMNVNLLDYVSKFRCRLLEAVEMASSNLESAQFKMKNLYDRRAKERTFQVGDKVLALLPLKGGSLQAKYSGPYSVIKKVNDTNYVIHTPERVKSKRLCHVNMLKAYHIPCWEGVNLSSVAINCVTDCCDDDTVLEFCDDVVECTPKMQNSDVLKDLDSKLAHITNRKERRAVKDLILEYLHIFSDHPTRTNVLEHDIDVGDAKPVKIPPYRLSPVKKLALDKEVQYMLNHGIIEPSQSEWSSPCLLVPKPNGTYRVVQDFRKVNSLTKNDCYPNKRLDDCIERVGSAKYISTFDMLKGYWGVPLSERARDISAFSTPEGIYRYKVMAMGLKNAAGSYQRLMNIVLNGMPDAESFQDDAILFNNTFKEHLATMRSFFQRVSDAGLTVNLVKSVFFSAQVVYLGHVLGHCKVKPTQARISAMLEYPAPQDRKSLMRFLGMIGFYRRFCPNLSDVVSPLTNMLKKDVPYVWNLDCETSFGKAKALLLSDPVLLCC